MLTARRRRINVVRGESTDAAADTVTASNEAVEAFLAGVQRQGVDIQAVAEDGVARPDAAAPPPQAHDGAAHDRRVRPRVEHTSARRWQCPLCRPYSTNGELRMLLAHVATAHGGEAIGPEARASFAGLNRGICSTPGCGALRDLDVPRCRKCRRNAPARALAEGDTVPTNSSRAEAPTQEDVAENEMPAAPADPLPPPWPAHDLPPDFLARVRRLSPQTLVHVPGAYRQRLCVITAACVEGSNVGDNSAALLEQARSKLLLAPVPKGCSTSAELGVRFALWEAGSFADLLVRLEVQAKNTADSRRQVSSFPRPGARARKLAQSGAYRKAVQSFGAAAANLTAEDEQRWARELLPDTTRQSSNGPIPAPVMPVEPADSQEVPKPLAGVHFSRLSGPGPTGMRPEHLRDMLSCKRRRAVNRLLRAIQATENAAEAGTLPDSWRWMLDSRLVFLAKKHGSKPRPVRVGEVWRRLIAKHMLHSHAARVRKRMLEAHQYGVSIPGGTEILVHARNVLEERLRADPATGVWAVVDLDFANAYPSLEWDAIDESMAHQLPELAAWTRWCHGSAGDVHLPSGGVHHARRGAEQGDPHGSVICGSVLADVSKRARAAFLQHKGTQLPEAFTAWYADDGQSICRPSDLDLYLACVDEAAAAVGATRGEGEEVKTHVRLIGHPDALASVPGIWVTERIARTCKIGEPNSAIEVLGVVVGSNAACEAQFCEKITQLRGLHQSLRTLDDTAAELTLGRICADVSRVVHLLRTSGFGSSEAATEQHDEAINEFVAGTLGGDLPEASLRQAAAGVAQGGLGFRRSADLAAAAFVASRAEARPFVAQLFAAMASEGVDVPGAMELYDEQANEAMQRVIARLSPARGAQVARLCADALATAEARLAAIEAGRALTAPGAPVGDGHAGAQLLGELGAEDPQHPAAAQQDRLQHSLAKLIDEDQLDRLARAMTEQNRDSDVRRLRELQDSTVSHEWLWALAPHAAGAIEPDAYIAAVRLRLGAGFASEPVPCQVCRGTLDPQGTHALCCAQGASTRGHNDVRDQVFDLARLADSTAETETLGLLEAAPGSRPADILTSAASPGRVSALDVGIASPEARHAGGDCCEAMRARKMAKYARHLPALSAEGVDYQPLIWSCWGREHPETTAVLTQLAKRASRRQGLASHAPTLRHARAQVGAALARRAAAMLRSCLPGG